MIMSLKKSKFCKKKLHKHIAKKKAMLVLVISEHLPCIPVCFSLILSVIPSGKKMSCFLSTEKCNAFVLSTKPALLEKKPQNQTNPTAWIELLGLVSV